MKTEYTREELIELCDKAIVPERIWRDRDSHEAQKNIAVCRGLLLCGCDFTILTIGDLKTDNNTIWIEISADGFACFEGGHKVTENFYIPSATRLLNHINKDWY